MERYSDILLYIMPARHKMIQWYINYKAWQVLKQFPTYKDAQMQYDKCHHSSILYNDILAASKATHIMYKAIFKLFIYLFLFLFYFFYFFFILFFFRIRNPYYCNRNCSCTFAKWERKNSVIGKYYSMTYWRLSKLPISCLYVEPFVLFNYYYFISLFIYLLFSF